MLTIICGEDSVSSRNFYFSLKTELLEKNYELFDTPAKSLTEVNSMNQTYSLFSSKKVFLTENLNKLYSKRSNPKFSQKIDSLIKDKDIEIYDWEDSVSGRNLKIKEAKIKEFKLSKNIFNFLESCYPGNLKNFASILKEIKQNNEESFIYAMLCRHARTLLLIKKNVKDKSIQPWQYYRLKTQVDKWEDKKLTLFYEGLHKIDIITKTGDNVYSYAESLDFLAAYIL